jgi:hypothetical protein
MLIRVTEGEAQESQRADMGLLERRAARSPHRV